MLLKKPVLSTDVPVANEFLVADLLMDKQSAAMAQKITEFAFNIGAWTELMQSAFVATEGQFTLEAMAKNTLSVYKNIVVK
jgi:glycosyltransferase involved in cell wall biosynthesis